MRNSPLEVLRHTLRQLRGRRRRLFLLQQLSLHCVALTLIILGVSLMAAGLQPGRAGSAVLWALTLILAGAVLWRCGRILRRQRGDDRALAHYVEEHIPDFEQRLLTSLEFNEQELQQGRAGVSRQFIQQLWEDAQQQVQQQQQRLATVAPARKSWLAFASATAVVATVAVLFATSERLLQAGSAVAWPFAMNASSPVTGQGLPATTIEVEPGDLQLLRGEGVIITARLTHAMPDSVRLRLLENDSRWREVLMTREGDSYSHFLADLQQDLTYQVRVDGEGGQRSPTYRIRLLDRPAVEQIDVAFDFPDYTGREDGLQQDNGDMLVPEGTVARLKVRFNRAVEQATVQFVSHPAAQQEEATVPVPYADLPLQLDGQTGSGSFTVHEDGMYRIVAVDPSGLRNDHSLDYLVRAIRDRPPELALQRPGGDREVMPLEEVLVQVAASDDYGLSELALHYSVVGREEVIVDFLAAPDARSAVGEELLYLEDLAVTPGDFVSYFLTVADNNGLQGPASVVSDIYFLQVVPTDQEFRRQPAAGGSPGAGGGAGDSSALVALQKDIIAATWKLRNQQRQLAAEEVAATAGIIAESQAEATDRAHRSIRRLAERLRLADDSYDTAVRSLSLAIGQMELATRELEQEEIDRALAPEQLALQHILQAQASVNRTSISMQQAGGGGGGARREREDLRDLFEMEMGRLENRYERPASAPGSSRENQQQLDRLQELARRQEALTRAQRQLARREQDLSEPQQRRELERLSRQQQQLGDEAAQLAQRPAPGNTAAADGQPPGDALQRIARQMQAAADSDSPSLAAARSQKALDSLRQQQRELGRQAGGSVRQLVQDLGRRGQQLLDRQRQLQQAMEETGRQLGLDQTRQAVRNDARLQPLLETQQQQRRELQHIDGMLTSLVNRTGGEEQRLLFRAQAASRQLQPISEDMQTGSRVLRSGMVNLAMDIEQEIGQQLQGLARSLADLGASPDTGSPSRDRQQAALDAGSLREQLQELQRQVLAYQAAKQPPDSSPVSLGELRQRLKRTQQLAQQLQQRLPTAGPAGGQQSADGRRSGLLRRLGQQLHGQDIEDFLNQPQLLTRLLQPVLELEAVLQGQARLDDINRRLSVAAEEDIPEQYRELVEQYYRVLAEGQEPVPSLQ